MTVKILAMSGSSRRDSLNQKLLLRAIEGAREAGAEVTLIRLADFALPLYDGDLEASDGLPEGAKTLRQTLAAHQALLIASPEYNGGYTALLKNSLDWISRPDEEGKSGVALFSGKLAAVVSASPGQLGGVRSQVGIRAVLEKLGLLVIPESIALGAAHSAFDETGLPKDPKVDHIAKSVGAALLRTASRLG